MPDIEQGPINFSVIQPQTCERMVGEARNAQLWRRSGFCCSAQHQLAFSALLSPPSPPSPHPSRLYSVFIPTVVRPHSLHSTDATQRFHWQIAFSRCFLNAPAAFYIGDSTIYSLLVHELHVHREPFMLTFSSYKVTQTGKVGLC